jgi:hypothetical protein
MLAPGCTAIVGVGDYTSGGSGDDASASDATSPSDAARKQDAQGSTPDAGKCSPGSTASCYCPGTTAGTATCQANGIFGACQCPVQDAGSGCSQPLCNGACCGSSQLCVKDANSGQLLCADVCTTNKDCGSTGCCAWLSFDGKTWNGQSACIGTSSNNGACRCTKSSECPGGACTPSLGFYTCEPNDGNSYNGCFGSTTCGSGYDCVGDCQGNEYCAASSASNCTGTWCNVANPPCFNAIFSCGNDCMQCSCK